MPFFLPYHKNPYPLLYPPSDKTCRNLHKSMFVVPDYVTALVLVYLAYWAF
ncbi:hypothetical protein DESC_190014 [Desulfosarcina cetonica]|nr:hypothetical protein DESC_190014 [Desulfosarcina cetonica]